MQIDYSLVTEVPGSRVSREQLARMFHRYCFARQFCERKEVLEVACGAGQGLGYLARRAKRVVGGDYTDKLVQTARDYYKGRLEVNHMDAQHLPFEERSFDVVILYEAIYYLAEPERFLKEARRILRNEGTLIIATVNKDWSEFNPSPYSTRYFSVPELEKMLRESGFRAEFFGAFSALAKGLKERAIAAIRKMAVRLHLIPKTMKRKEFFKRVFYGQLLQMKEEIQENDSHYLPPVTIPADRPNYEYKVIYAVARV
jgi:SAM-dependent methyltransferase